MPSIDCLISQGQGVNSINYSQPRAVSPINYGVTNVASQKCALNGSMDSRFASRAEGGSHLHGSVDSLYAIRFKRCQLAKAQLVDKYEDCMGLKPPPRPKPKHQELDFSKFPSPSKKQKRSTVSSPLRQYVETAGLIDRLAAESTDSEATEPTSELGSFTPRSSLA
jgi:hypothetical protein